MAKRGEMTLEQTGNVLLALLVLVVILGLILILFLPSIKEGIKNLFG